MKLHDKVWTINRRTGTCDDRPRVPMQGVITAVHDKDCVVDGNTWCFAHEIFATREEALLHFKDEFTKWAERVQEDLNDHMMEARAEWGDLTGIYQVRYVEIEHDYLFCDRDEAERHYAQLVAGGHEAKLLFEGKEVK